METKQMIADGKTALGIEFGSTRIKVVLIDKDHHPIASGSHDWENRLENNILTYTLEDIWSGLQDSYQNLVNDVKEKYDILSLSVYQQTSRAEAINQREGITILTQGDDEDTGEKEYTMLWKHK